MHLGGGGGYSEELGQGCGQAFLLDLVSDGLENCLSHLFHTNTNTKSANTNEQNEDDGCSSPDYTIENEPALTIINTSFLDLNAAKMHHAYLLRSVTTLNIYVYM